MQSKTNTEGKEGKKMVRKVLFVFIKSEIK